MDKKKKRDLNIEIISSRLMVQGGGILFLYCLIATLITWSLLEHQQKGEW